MTWALINASGAVAGLFANSQPGIPGVIEIEDTDARVVAFLTPPPTEAAYAAAIQSWLDTSAQSQPYGYDDIVSAISYVGSSNDLWNRQGVAFKSWRDSVWGAAYSLMAKVQAGTVQAPAVNAITQQLPQPSIPTV